MKLRLPNKLKAAVVAAVTAVVYATLGTATFAAAAQSAEETGKTLHVYILTGQSNSLGAVKGDPASAETLGYYSTDKGGSESVKMWDGNMAGSLSDPTTGGIAWSNEGKTWMTVQPQQAPSGNGSHGKAGTPYENLTGQADLRSAWEGGQGNGVMGPEYGFAYMMQKKGWNDSGANDVAVIKVSRDGGGNSNWVKPTTQGQVNGYTFLLEGVLEALKNVDNSYDTVELDGLMYLQGESDAAGSAEISQAKQRYQAFVENLKADLSAAGITAEIKLNDSVVGEPATWNGTDRTTGNTTTAKELLALSQENEHVGYVYTRDLGKINSGDTMGVHYDGNSEITIGARYAYAMAATQGMDTTEDGSVRVRSQKYGDPQLNETAVSLNDAAAWWQSSGDAVAYSAASMADTVAVWDVSSANMGATTQGAETLAADLSVKGIRIEDPYADDDTTGTHNATITIKNAEGKNATLTVGAAGIELQRGNLNLQTKVATNAAQTWTVAGGKKLTVANSIGGTDTVTLHKHADVTAAAAAQFDFSAVTDAGQRTWNIGDGVQVALSDTGFANSNVAVEASAAATLSGGAVSINSLTLNNGASLDLAGGLTLSAGTVSVGDTAALTFNYSNGSFSALNAGSISAGENSAVTINLGHVTSLSRAEFTLGTGWSGWTVSAEAGSGKVLSLGSSAPAGYHLSVDSMGHLILSGVPTYPDVQKTWVTTPAGATVTAAADRVAGTSAQLVEGSTTDKAVLMDGAGGNWLLYGANKTVNVGAGNALYTEMRVGTANFIGNVGTFAWTDRATSMAGDYNMKIADGTSIASVFGASNITVDGNVYTELSADNATYTNGTYGVVGAFGADVSGNVTLVINGGHFNSGVNVWGSKFNRTANTLGDLSIEVNGGNLQNIYVSDANAHTIKSAQVILNGGTVNGSVYGSNSNVTITEGTSVYIGGDAVVKGDVFGGIANAKTGEVTLHDMAENAAFLTNFGSGKGIYADTIVLNDTTIGSGFNGTLHANKVTINEGSSLAAGKLADGANLGGNGVYRLASGTYALGANTSLSAENWQGTVSVSGVNQAANTATGTTFGFEQLGNANSSVQIINSQFAMATGTHDYAGRVILGGDTATAAGDMRIVYGQSAGGTLTYNLSGDVSGKGGITNSWAHSGVTVAFNFTGDISEWTGTYKQTASSSSSLTFGGNAHTVNAEITKSGGSGNLHITANTAVTFNNRVNVQSLTAGGQNITLGSNGEGSSATQGALTVSGAATMASLTMGSGTTAAFNGAATISGAVSNSGLLTVNNTLTLTGNAATAKNLGKVAGTGTIVANSTNGNRVYTLSGDLSGWTGAFEQSAGSGSMTLNIENTAVLNADITNKATTSAACVLNLNLKQGMTVNGTLDATSKGPLNVTLAGDTTFNNTTSVNNLNAAGKTVTLGSNGAGETATHGNLTVAGTAAIGSAHLGDGTNLCFLNQSAPVSLNNLSIGSNSVVSAYEGAVSGVEALETTLRVSGTLQAAANAAVNADLVLADGATLNVQNGGITMGSTVALGTNENFVLNGAVVNGGVLENYVLFTGVDGLTLNGTAITEMGWYDATAVIGSITANGAALDTASHSYVIGYWNGTVSLAESTVPEPATATLSLLALAALAARRKRK